jgi:hypothetical protein
MVANYSEDIIQKGADASRIESLLGPYIQQEIMTRISHLTAAYRSDTLSHDKMVGMVGAISALQEVMSNLDSIQRQAIQAAEREYGSQAEGTDNAKRR